MRYENLHRIRLARNGDCRRIRLARNGVRTKPAPPAVEGGHYAGAGSYLILNKLAPAVQLKQASVPT